MTRNSNNGKAPGRRAASWLRRLSRKQALIALGALLAFDLGFYIMAVRPLGAREQMQQDLIAGLSAQIEKKSADVERLELVVSKVEKARDEGDQLLDDITLVRRTTYSTLLAELLQAAADSGIDTREGNFDLEPIEGTEQYGMVSINANFRGEYENLVQFLNRLDRSERFLILGSLGATPRADSSELQITLTIDTFVREL